MGVRTGGCRGMCPTPHNFFKCSFAADRAVILFVKVLQNVCALQLLTAFYVPEDNQLHLSIEKCSNKN